MYILADGGRITASDPSEFVRLLREGSWFDSGCTDKEYMVNFSNRYHGVCVTARGDGEDRHAGAFHGRPEKVRLHKGLREPVPLLLRSLPVHSSPVGIFFFFHSI